MSGIQILGMLVGAFLMVCGIALLVTVFWRR